ncbi:Crp/Fnr family transcriptional regulator [Brevundimonas balnearis]|uniref:Crp/Fnr family transcriptional regulator n=1 Tax=Brevundimonas balnearis TaxID=1572858 RepID=A0ABV6R394_9CAUL
MQNLWLAQLPSADRARVERVTEVRPFSKGDILYETGETPEAVWFPTQGVIGLATVIDADRSVDSALIGPEGLVGVTCGPMNARAVSRAVARSEGAALCVAADRFAEMLEASAPLREALSRFTEALFAQVQQTAACNAQHPLEARFSRRLLDLQDRLDADRLELTQFDVAAMLGVRRATVSEVGALVEDRGLIRRGRGWMRIVDRKGLEGLACGCYGALRRVGEDLGVAA